MKTSELIGKLSESIFYHGDVEVMTDGEWDWQAPELEYCPRLNYLVIR